MAVGLETRLKVQVHTWKKEKDGTVYVRNPASTRSFALNPGMAQMWVRFNGRLTLAEVFDMIEKEEGEKLDEGFRTAGIEAAELLVSEHLITEVRPFLA